MSFIGIIDGKDISLSSSFLFLQINFFWAHLVSFDTNLSIVALTLYICLASIYFSVKHPADVVFVVFVVVITPPCPFPSLSLSLSLFKYEERSTFIWIREEKEGGWSCRLVNQWLKFLFSIALFCRLFSSYYSLTLIFCRCRHRSHRSEDN